MKVSQNAAWTRRRNAARKYQPARIRLLLIAASPPSEDEYFYFEDADSGDSLFEEVGNVLFETSPAGDKIPYLKELRRRGVFLIDAKPDAPREGEAWGPYVAPLVLNVETLAPEQIVVLDAGVYDAARSAMENAKLPIVDVRVPAPDGSGGPEFRQKLRQALVRANLEKLIRPLRSAKAEAKPRGKARE